MVKPYLITMDGVEVLVRKFGITEVNDTPGLRDSIIEVQENLAKAMTNLIPRDYKLEIVYASNLSKEMDAAVSRIRKIDGSALVVSLDNVYGSNADFHLEVTRETNPMDDSYRIASRFGAPAIDVQLTMLKQMLDSVRRYDSVILTDVGSFEGKTLDFIIVELEKLGITVSGIVLGASSEMLANKLKNRYDSGSAVVDVLSTDQSEKYEWLEMRDLLLIDGRKVPDAFTEDGIRRYIPYTENLRDYASIPEDKIEECKALCRNSYNQVTGLLRNAGVDVKKRVGEFAPLVKSRDVS